MIYECKVCGYRYDESTESVPFDSLADDWYCPVCGVGREMFEPIAGSSSPKGSAPLPEVKAAETSNETRLDSQKESNSENTYSDLLAHTMCDFGVRWVFGMVGHSNLGMAEAVRKLCDKGKLGYIGIRHEGAGAFACSAYGKLTGRPAACLSIAGPGATNLLTGLSDAKLDRAPVIALMGQVPTSDIGLNIFQEINLKAVCAPIAVSSQTIYAGSNCGEVMRTACRSAIIDGGVAQIILPDDVQSLPAGDAQFTSADGSIFKDVSAPSASEIANAASVLSKSRSPVVIVGAGCAKSIDLAVELAEYLDCPLMTTYKAKGYVPDSHPLACGVVGRSGTAVAAKFVSESDLLIGLGIGFSRHSEIPKGKKILQIDRDPKAIGRLRKVDCGLVGDMASTLRPLISAIGMPRSYNTSRAVAQQWSAWRAEKAKRAAKSVSCAISQSAVCEALNACVPSDAIISIDVGNVAYAFGRYFEAKKQRMLLSWYLGSIGCGLPSAMGAWCATKEKDSEFFGRSVVAVVGDGGLGQYLSDWTTVVKNGMDIKCVVFNNSELAKISLEQRNSKIDVWETDLLNPNLAEYSELCGGKGVRIEEPDELAEKLAQAMDEEGPVLIEILTNSEPI